MPFKKCPQCEGIISLRLRDFIIRSSENPRCENCGTELEIANHAACSALNGLIFSTVFMGLSAAIETGWLRLLAAGAVCWLIDPVIIFIGAERRKVSYRDEDVIKVQRWSTIASISGWLAGTAAVVASFNLISFFQEMIISLDKYYTSNDIDALEGMLGREALLWVVAAAVFGLAAFAVSAISTMITTSLRHEERCEPEGGEAEASGANI